MRRVRYLGIGSDQLGPTTPDGASEPVLPKVPLPVLVGPAVDSVCVQECKRLRDEATANLSPTFVSGAGDDIILAYADCMNNCGTRAKSSESHQAVSSLGLAVAVSLGVAAIGFVIGFLVSGEAWGKDPNILGAE